MLAALVVIVSLGTFAASARAADTIWWASYDSSTVSFANLDGSGSGGDLNTTGATAPNQVAGVALDPAAGRVYWANAGSGVISYANLDGSGGGGDLNTSGATVGGVRGLAIDPALGRLYWGNSTGVYYANLDNSGGGSLNTGSASVHFPYGVAVDQPDNRIYWANFDLSVTPTNKISFTALDGSGGGADLTVTGATIAEPKGVAIDQGAGRIYWVNSAAGALGKVAGADLNGANGGDFNVTGASSTGSSSGPALDPGANKLYWAGSDVNKISVTNLDRSGGNGDIATTGGTISDPSFAAILKAPVPTGNPVVSGDTTTGSTLTCSTGSWAADLLGAFLYRAPHAFAYQWMLDGSDIPGGTANNVTASSPGAYACRVTASNAAGSGGPETSAPLQVTAPPPPAQTPSSPLPTGKKKRCKKAKKHAAAAAKCKKKKG